MSGSRPSTTVPSSRRPVQRTGPRTPRQAARVYWAWGPIAGIVLPLLLLVIVAAI